MEGGTTRRNNFNWGANFAPQSSGGKRFSSISPQYQTDNVRRPNATENSFSLKTTNKTSFLERLPNMRWNDYRSTSLIET